MHFWLIEALYVTGRHEDARALFEEMVARCTPAGLLSEDIDPNTGELWGIIRKPIRWSASSTAPSC